MRNSEALHECFLALKDKLEKIIFILEAKNDVHKFRARLLEKKQYYFLEFYPLLQSYCASDLLNFYSKVKKCYNDHVETISTDLDDTFIVQEEKPTTSKEDNPTTSKEDNPTTSKEDNPITSKADNPTTSKEDNHTTSKEDQNTQSKRKASGDYEPIFSAEENIQESTFQIPAFENHEVKEQLNEAFFEDFDEEFTESDFEVQNEFQCDSTFEKPMMVEEPILAEKDLQNSISNNEPFFGDFEDEFTENDF